MSGRSLVVVLVLSSAARAGAQPLQPREPLRLLQVLGGVGVTFAEDQDRYSGQGLGGYLGAELVFRPGSFFQPRLYAGALATFPDADSCRAAPCDVESKIFFLGAKVRLMAPIPYVGPFVDVGLGASLGYLRTLDLDHDERVRGAAFHIPFALGLAIGKRHELDLSFSYLVHPAQDQVAGAFAFGLGFPLP